MEGLGCVMCRHWRRVGPRSEVGRCENRDSGQSFTKEHVSCSHFKVMLYPDPPQRPVAQSTL
jgi:hypothetical protein